MVKLYAKHKILRGDEVIDPKVEPVFDATPDEAKQMDALKAARPATKDEIEAAKERAAKANGQSFQSPSPSDTVVEADPPPPSGAKNDPNSPPSQKSKSD